jgi:hypothetical protein
VDVNSSGKIAEMMADNLAAMAGEEEDPSGEENTEITMSGEAIGGNNGARSGLFTNLLKMFISFVI